MARRTLAATTFLAALLLIGCGSARSNTPPTATPRPDPGPIVIAAGEPIVIGVSAALTGDQSAAGLDLANAVELAVADFNRQIKAHNVTTRAEDDGCNDAEKASAAATALSDVPGIAGVVGPMCTTGAQAANDVFDAGGIVHITPAATRNDLSGGDKPYFFRTAWRDDAQAAVQVAYARDTLLADTAIILDDSEPYGKTLGDAFVAGFEAAGGQILSRERIKRNLSEFGPLSRQINAQAPDIVVFEGFDPQGALLLRALRAAGSTARFMGPDSLLSVPDFAEAAGEDAEGAVITGSPQPDTGFVDRFTAKYGHAPSTAFVLQAYDATRILLTAVESVAREDGDGRLVIDRAALAEAMRAQSFAGLTGTIRFDARGDRSGPSPREAGLAIYRVTSGAFEVVDPP